VLDENNGEPRRYPGPGREAYLGIRAVLDRHLSRAKGAKPSDYTLAKPTS
jgi:hypothetical protein